MTNLVVLQKEDLNDLLRRAGEDAANRVVASIMDKVSPMRPRHVTQTQAAEMLNLSKSTICRMVKSGSIRLNKCGLISIEQIDAIVK